MHLGCLGFSYGPFLNIFSQRHRIQLSYAFSTLMISISSFGVNPYVLKSSYFLLKFQMKDDRLILRALLLPCSALLWCFMSTMSVNDIFQTASFTSVLNFRWDDDLQAPAILAAVLFSFDSLSYGFKLFLPSFASLILYPSQWKLMRVFLRLSKASSIYLYIESRESPKSSLSLPSSITLGIFCYQSCEFSFSRLKTLFFQYTIQFSRTLMYSVLSQT